MRCKTGPAGFMVPLRQLSKDLGLYSFDLALTTEESVQETLGETKETLDGVIIKATVGADKWHRHLGHMNVQAMGKKRKIDRNGVDYTDTLDGCDVCTVTECQQQTRPKTAKMSTVTSPMLLVNIILEDPASSNAFEKVRFVSKFIDHYTRWHV